MDDARVPLSIYFTHKRQIPKWLFFLGFAALAILFPAPLGWLFALVGFFMEFPSEYIIHRFTFHADPKTLRGFRLRIAKAHAAHHAAPQDPSLLFNFAAQAIALGILLFAVESAIAAVATLSLVTGVRIGIALSVGNFAGLLYYEWQHFAAHFVARPRLFWVRWMKTHHLRHHFLNEHYWFGITQPTLDKAFHTEGEIGVTPASPTVRDLHRPAQVDEALRAR
ncbi:MAG: sterol desaturase family protein [Thermoplasmatota archaeon]